ncbi:transcriptional repressor CTCF-like isoform X1 [Mycetomoellerius zeteki]|uniref:transcriptional repressor CTCF-like isoform X1 n=2 Tax=Mycetomoellerius zeteki TaxID=64791 RepID=UPI00084E6FB9|nr:PREDICTED: transcriptional repressor CTCF-like isoform X1 [Trachymyrmex zeteki]XP_018313820.1 PREDICTED: transcriptional repressor CTCF-like isoform X1 [Trachymyrmex zeteki]
MESNPAPLYLRRICRFCLSDAEPLNSIYERNHNKSIQLPLQLQIMSCVAIEVYTEDEMPQVICNTCRWNLDHLYKFKLQCKKADEALQDYLLSGKLPKPFPPIPINPPTKIGNKRLAESRSQNKVSKKQSTSDDDSRDTREKRETRKREKERERKSQNASEQHLYEEEQNRGSESEQEASNINENRKQEPAEIRVHPCDQCERTFALRQALLLHVQRVHIRARNYKCNECEKNFFNKHDLSKHLSIHSQEKPYSCLICQKQFSRQTSLQRHKKVHKDETHYACPDCDDEFFTTEELEEHKDLAHKKEKRFCCNICNKRFLYKQGLQRHEILHNNKDEKFMCDYCKETFRTCTKLARHLSTHAGPRPYMCKLCPRTFLLSHHLTRHMRMSHSTDKRRVYKNGKKSLKMNQLTHAKRTYMGLTCDVCQESCRNRADYVIHIKQHIEAGEKIGSLQSNTKKNFKLKFNEKEEKEKVKDQHSNRNDDHEPPAYVVKKLPKPPMTSENEKEKEQNREDKKEKSEKQEKEKPNVMYVRSKHGSMVKITTFPPIERIHDIQEQTAIFKNTKQTTSIDSSSQGSSKGLMSSQIEETPKSSHVDTETQVQKIVTSVFKEQKTSLKHQQNGQDQSKESLTPVMGVYSSSQESCEDNDKAEILGASTPKIIKVKRIKRIVVQKPTGRNNEETPASTSGIKDGDSSLSGIPGSLKVKRVIVSRIIRKNDITEVIMNPDGTTINSAELTKLSTGSVVKREVRKLPLDKNQNLIQALLQSAKQRQETEGTSASSSNDTLKSSEKKQLITQGQDQEIQGETEAVGEAEIVDVQAIGEVAEIVEVEAVGEVAEIVEIEN